MDSSSSSSMERQYNQERRRLTSSLHSVRKPSAKPWKKPAGLLPSKVYRVDSSNFRRVVQKLTGAPEFQSRRLQTVAPPPLDLVTSQPTSNFNVSESLQPNIVALSSNYSSPEGPALPMQSLHSQEILPIDAQNGLPPNYLTLDSQPSVAPLALFSPVLPSLTPLGLSTPSWFHWSSLPLPSPGTLATAVLDTSTVLWSAVG